MRSMLLLALPLVLITSCRKKNNYTCTCRNSGGVIETLNYEAYEVGDADRQCYDRQTQWKKAGAFYSNTSCDITGK